MNHFEETVLKFSAALGKIDSIKDVRYKGKCYGYYVCVCGQKIKNGYLFENKQNNKVCIVGKKCLQYIADYLDWS